MEGKCWSEVKRIVADTGDMKQKTRKYVEGGTMGKGRRRSIKKESDKGQITPKLFNGTSKIHIIFASNNI